MEREGRLLTVSPCKKSNTSDTGRVRFEDGTNLADGRDVMERMIKAGCAATSDFEWLSQLRFVFSREEGPFGMVSVRQTNCQLDYSYEYQVRPCQAPWRSET